MHLRVAGVLIQIKSESRKALLAQFKVSKERMVSKFKDFTKSRKNLLEFLISLCILDPRTVQFMDTSFDRYRFLWSEVCPQCFGNINKEKRSILGKDCHMREWANL